MIVGHNFRTKKPQQLVKNNNNDTCRINLWWNNNTWVNTKLGITITPSSWSIDDHSWWTM